MTTELNDGHLIEFVDRVHVARTFLQQSLASHPVACCALVEREVALIDGMLGDLYQRLAKFDNVSALLAGEKTPRS